jgi:hypothetical protein
MAIRVVKLMISILPMLLFSGQDFFASFSCPGLSRHGDGD